MKNHTTCSCRVAILYARCSLPHESPAISPASLLPGSHLPAPVPEAACTLRLVCLSSPWSVLPADACTQPPRPTASLLPGQSRLPALAPLPRQIASLLLVSLACRCLWPTYSTFTESAPVVHTSANLPRPRYTLYTFHGSH